MKKGLWFGLFLLFFGCKPSVLERARDFVSQYTKTYVALRTQAKEAQWRVNTYIVEGDEDTPAKAAKAEESLDSFIGSQFNIDQARMFLDEAQGLDSTTLRELRAILYKAAANPATTGALVKDQIKEEIKQTRNLYGFEFKINGRTVTTSDIDAILKHSNNLVERLAAWKASKEVGCKLKNGLDSLRNLRNKAVCSLGYDNFFQYEVSDYGYTVPQMRALCDSLILDLWPLYRELHTWTRYELARRYHQPVPEMIPAHWLPNRWGQDWSAVVNIKACDADSALKVKSPEWIIAQGENFYRSLGFPKLPESFYENSSLYPLTPDAGFKKNNHSSAWHIDLQNDVRALMSIEPDLEWWETSLHELGHVYYYLTYTNDKVPPLLRTGANRAYHEAIGSLMGLASTQQAFLDQLGLVDTTAKADPNRVLLKQALSYVVFIPFSAGVMTSFEDELYADNLPENEFNARWWELKKNYQGIAPPEPRDERFCDAATKTHINDDPGQYYDYALSTALLFQLHMYIANNILHQDPHNANYYGHQEVGKFLRNLMMPGANVDWQKQLLRSTGSGISARSMAAYFAPLLDYLKKINRGRTYTLPETLPR